MSPHLRLTAAALIGLCVLAGCSTTTTGTATMPSESKLTDAPRTSVPRSTTPRTPRSTEPSTPRSPSGQPPGDAATITCEEYVELDPDAQQATIDEILATEGSVLTPENADVAKTLADAVCQFLPQSTVAEILLGTTPP